MCHGRLGADIVPSKFEHLFEELSFFKESLILNPGFHLIFIASSTTLASTTKLHQPSAVG